MQISYARNRRPKTMQRETGRSQQLIKRLTIGPSSKREVAQATHELKAEFERLAKIHRSLDKK
jgi:hypothetical protein